MIDHLFALIKNYMLCERKAYMWYVTIKEIWSLHLRKLAASNSVNLAKYKSTAIVLNYKYSCKYLIKNKLGEQKKLK